MSDCSICDRHTVAMSTQHHDASGSQQPSDHLHRSESHILLTRTGVVVVAVAPMSSNESSTTSNISDDVIVTITIASTLMEVTTTRARLAPSRGVVEAQSLHATHGGGDRSYSFVEVVLVLGAWLIAHHSPWGLTATSFDVGCIPLLL